MHRPPPQEQSAPEPGEQDDELYEDAPCGYISAAPGGELVKVNRTLLAWTGYTRDELLGRRFQDLLTPGGRIYHETHYAPLLRMQGAVREIALELVCADGRPLPVLVNSVLRTDDDGRPLLVRTTVFDATHRRQYERELLLARERERAARRRMERLQRLSAVLAAAVATREMAAAVVDELAQDLGAGEAALALVGPSTPQLQVVARHPAPDAAHARATTCNGRDSLPSASSDQAHSSTMRVRATKSFEFNSRAQSTGRPRSRQKTRADAKPADTTIRSRSAPTRAPAGCT
ncbi:MAG: PAS domain-containing protein [Actinobacteria bacterium]|nr:PAS domain-containing protein [Actinomycetota bacterium]